MPDDEQAALDAFEASFEETTPDEPVEQAEIEPDPALEAPDDPGTTDADAEDSFSGFDETLLSQLPPELQAAVVAQTKSIQGAATRKFQEAAKLRDQFEGIDLELAKNAVTYMERLSEDDFLVEAAAAMQAELERKGLTPAQAKQVTETAIEEQLADDDDYEIDSDLNPELQSKIRELEERAARQDAREAERDQEARLSYLANETLKAETAIRKDNPEWDDSDIINLYKLAPSLKGDLHVAAETYRQQEAHFAKRLLKQKSSVPNSITTPPSSGSSTEPAKKWTLEEGHEMAKEALANILANE